MRQRAEWVIKYYYLTVFFFFLARRGAAYYKLREGRNAVLIIVWITVQKEEAKALRYEDNACHITSPDGSVYELVCEKVSWRRIVRWKWNSAQTSPSSLTLRPTQICEVYKCWSGILDISHAQSSWSTAGHSGSSSASEISLPVQNGKRLRSYLPICVTRFPSLHVFNKCFLHPNGVRLSDTAESAAQGADQWSAFLIVPAGDLDMLWNGQNLNIALYFLLSS